MPFAIEDKDTALYPTYAHKNEQTNDADDKLFCSIFRKLSPYVAAATLLADINPDSVYDRG